MTTQFPPPPGSEPPDGDGTSGSSPGGTPGTPGGTPGGTSGGTPGGTSGGTYGTPPGGTPGAPGGPPSYPPPPGPPPGGYSAGPPPGGGADRTTLWGVLGIVIGLICCGPLGIIFGALSIRDAKRFGKSPVLGWVAIVLSVLGLVGNIIFGLNGTYPGMN
jgi:hypothetical protein